jgi:hypothetical protein
MAGVAPRLGPGELAVCLGALGVRVEAAEVRIERVLLADYPGGRPSSVVRLSGGGHSGEGENVAFEPGEHERFVATVGAWFRSHACDRPLEVDSALPELPSPYERAALEAALIDLALRQANVTLAKLTGAERRSLGFVASLGTTENPRAAIAALRAARFEGGLKLDADPGWSGAVLTSLGGVTGVEIVDFKRRGDAAFARDLAALFPDARLEDPPDTWAPDVVSPARLARDATLLAETDVEAALARGESVNLKAPRMGGPLAVLRSLELAWRRDRSPTFTTAPPFEARAYLGGMFEVGVGRTQAQTLAALYCPDAPNDLAPNRRAPAGAPRQIDNPPALVRFDAPGFGTREHAG